MGSMTARTLPIKILSLYHLFLSSWIIWVENTLGSYLQCTESNVWKCITKFIYMMSSVLFQNVILYFIFITYLSKQTRLHSWTRIIQCKHELIKSNANIKPCFFYLALPTNIYIYIYIYNFHHTTCESMCDTLPSTATNQRCPWCSRYRRRKWARRYEFKSCTRMIAFHIALIPLGKVWIQ